MILKSDIFFDTAPCSLGFVLAAKTERGVCAIRLGDSECELENALRHEYSNIEHANIEHANIDYSLTVARDTNALRDEMNALQKHLNGEDRVLDLVLDMRGTLFQIAVWRALQIIPWGETRTYTQLAQMIGKPQAVRAVASACAANGLALAVPCHRIVRRDGTLSGFRWNISRKAQLLELEGAFINEKTQPLLFSSVTS